jgi:hypothetical protein
MAIFWDVPSDTNDDGRVFGGSAHVMSCALMSQSALENRCIKYSAWSRHHLYISPSATSVFVSIVSQKPADVSGVHTASRRWVTAHLKRRDYVNTWRNISEHIHHVINIPYLRKPWSPKRSLFFLFSELQNPWVTWEISGFQGERREGDCLLGCCTFTWHKPTNASKEVLAAFITSAISNKSSKHLQNVCQFLLDYTAHHPKSQSVTFMS